MLTMFFPSFCPACLSPDIKHDQNFVYCMSCNAYKMPLKWYQRPFVQAEKQAWWWRLLIVVWVGYTFKQYLSNPTYPIERMANFINAIDFGIHELGHILFIPFGEFMTILGGSLFQCIFPLMWLAVCIRKRWYFAACLCLCWFGFNLMDVGAYVADARARLFPLATFSSDYDSAHDWYQILSRLDKLQFDTAIGTVLRNAGSVFIVLGMLLTGILLATMLSHSLSRLFKIKD